MWWPRSSATRLGWLGSRCCTRMTARFRPVGSCAMRRLLASRPPDDAPIAMMIGPTGGERAADETVALPVVEMMAPFPGLPDPPALHRTPKGRRQPKILRPVLARVWPAGRRRSPSRGATDKETALSAAGRDRQGGEPTNDCYPLAGNRDSRGPVKWTGPSGAQRTTGRAQSLRPATECMGCRSLLQAGAGVRATGSEITQASAGLPQPQRRSAE